VPFERLEMSEAYNKALYKTGFLYLYTSTTTTVLRPFFRDHPGEPVPEENFCTLWCKGRLKEADTPTIRLGATPSGLTSAHLHHPPIIPLYIRDWNSVCLNLTSVAESRLTALRNSIRKYFCLLHLKHKH